MTKKYHICFLRLSQKQSRHLCQIVIFNSIDNTSKINSVLDHVNLEELLSKDQIGLVAHQRNENDAVTAQKLCHDHAKSWNRSNPLDQMIIIDIPEAIVKKNLRSKMNQI